MAVSLHSEPPRLPSSSKAPKTRARARASLNPFGGPLLPSGSPFGWNACDRAIYVQFLTALLLLIVVFSFAVLDGWPFLLRRPDDEMALRTTTILAAVALLFWLGLYVWTRRFYVRRGIKNSWLLVVTITAHIVTGTAVCYALGPYTAVSGLITVAALLLGMVLLERRWLWIAVGGWLLSMSLMHLASKAGVLPFLSLFEVSFEQPDIATVAVDRAVAAALIYIPLAVIMDHLISVWRQDERSLSEAAQFDSLTGAYTRGFAMSVMERAILKAGRDGSRLAVLMLD
ncbi:MAG: GGDEF domain-containing protein [Deltaproteobacteria bacterium]|nr:GGDEF domain-containing protein [Deltaproteobacteria bacterium]